MDDDPMADVIRFPRDVVSTQIGDRLRLHTGAEMATYVRDEDDGTSPNFPDGAVVVDLPIFQPRRDVVIPAEFDPLVLTMTAAEARCLGQALIEAAETIESREIPE
jgi:hypothetical protein